MTKGSLRLRRAVAGAAAVATATAGLIPMANSVGAASGFSFTRLEGANRFATARTIAVSTFGTASTVLIGRADLFPDALAGGYLAGSAVAGGAPILLTTTDSLSPETDEAIRTLGANRAILLGGTSAIGVGVESALRARNIQVERVGGANRFETARLVAERPGPANVGAIDNQKTALIASGRNFPDALAGSPASYAGKLPTLLTEPGTLAEDARRGLQNLGIQQVYVLGGFAAVSDSVVDQIRGMGIVVNRLQGVNRSATAVAIADFAISKLGFSTTHVNLARGDNFVDALAGGPHGGNELAPLLLSTNFNTLGGETKDALVRRASTLTSGHIFGGLAAVTQGVQDEATLAAGAGRATISLTSTNVGQGGAVTGRITGDNITSTTVSGCGLTDSSVTRDPSGNFSFSLPGSQQTGPCTLTFTVRFSDNTTEVYVFNITVGVSAASQTDAPELMAASFVRTVAKPNAPGSTPTSFQATTVRFTFDEQVTGASVKPRLFRLSRYDVSDRFFEGQEAQVDPNDANSVLVVFGQAPVTVAPLPPSPPAGPVGTLEMNFITTATVAFGAVADNTALPNLPGDAGLGGVTFGAGKTQAPDLLSAGNFRGNFDSTRTLVDLTFDQAADVGAPGRNPADNGATGFNVILNDADATQRACTFVSGPEGSTTIGDMTSVLTVQCGGVGVPLFTAGDVARVWIARATVRAVDSAARNPVQAADVATNGTTVLPDLLSVSLRPDASIDGVAVDQVVYTFDEPVILPSPGDTGGCNPRDPLAPPCFALHYFDGTGVLPFHGPAGSGEVGTGGTGCSATNPVTGTVGCGPTRSVSNPAEVIVTFPDDAIRESSGAIVFEGAVLEAVGTGGVNRRNRVDTVGTQAVTFGPGQSTGPELVSCSADPTERDPFTGEVRSFRIIFLFDEPVDTVGGADDFHLYAATGQRIVDDPAVAGTPAVSQGTAAADQTKVFLTGFTPAQVRAVKFCAVDLRVVTRDGRGDPNSTALNGTVGAVEDEDSGFHNPIQGSPFTPVA